MGAQKPIDQKRQKLTTAVTTVFFSCRKSFSWKWKNGKKLKYTLSGNTLTTLQIKDVWHSEWCILFNTEILKFGDLWPLQSALTLSLSLTHTHTFQDDSFKKTKNSWETRVCFFLLSLEKCLSCSLTCDHFSGKCVISLSLTVWLDGERWKPPGCSHLCHLTFFIIILCLCRIP